MSHTSSKIQIKTILCVKKKKKKKKKKEKSAPYWLQLHKRGSTYKHVVPRHSMQHMCPTPAFLYLPKRDDANMYPIRVSLTQTRSELRIVRVKLRRVPHWHCRFWKPTALHACRDTPAGLTQPTRTSQCGHSWLSTPSTTTASC